MKKKDNKNKSSPPNKRGLNKARKFEEELPEIATKYGIRVSNPYGYYPEDVDKVITKLEAEANNLSKDNKELRDKVGTQEKEINSLRATVTELKLQMSVMQIPDVSPLESAAMLGRMETITGNYEEMPVNPIPQPNRNIDTSNIKTVGGKKKNNTASVVNTENTNDTPHKKFKLTKKQ